MKKMLLIAAALISLGNHAMAIEAADVAAARMVLQSVCKSSDAAALQTLKMQLNRSNPVNPYTNTTLDALKNELIAAMQKLGSSSPLYIIIEAEYNAIKDW